ncbi:MAG: sugar ABC transporter ATP-binding protein [Eubacteriales bacterium]
MHSLVEMKGITKKFPGVVALNDISFSIDAGEVHILLGENGAGKSTLMKILSGIYEPTDGQIVVEGESFERLNPKLSIDKGISIIHQELSVVEELSIMENIFIGKLATKKFLGMNIIDSDYMKKRTKEVLEQLGIKKDPETLVGELRISEKQVVEIAKAIAFNAKVIIMDEPTSSLTDEEVEKLFAIIKNLRAQGKGIVYISHKMNEIKKIGDRVSVLKDGTYVGTREVKNTEIDELIKMMVGREVKNNYLSTRSQLELRRKKIFEAINICRKDQKVKNVSFEVYEGEVLGFAGLVGSGRTELMEAIFGAVPSSGEIYLKSIKINNKNCYQAIKQGIGLVTENRRETGFFHNFNIAQNTAFICSIKESALGGLSGLINQKKDRKIANEFKDTLNVKCRGLDQNITELSGGNQQKVIIGKWIASNTEMLIFDEPTKGIDIGSKSEIYKIMRELAESGKVVIMISSEMPELLAVCDRIAVFNTGKIKEIYCSDEVSEELILKAATAHD